MDPESKRIAAVRAVRRWAPAILSVVGASVMATSGIVEGNTTLWGLRVSYAVILIVGGALVLLWQAVIVVRRTQRRELLEGERTKFARRAEAAETAMLRVMREELIALEHLAGGYSAERVSLFRRDGERFTLMARYSACPPFDESLGRSQYPLDQGVLGKAWKEGVAGDADLPSAGVDPSQPNKQWLRAQEGWNLAETAATELRMRSRSYAAFRVASAPAGGDPIGVIVFESTRSVPERDGTGIDKPLLTVDEIKPLVDEASARLAGLLSGSRCMSTELVGQLLFEQQGRGSA